MIWLSGTGELHVFAIDDVLTATRHINDRGERVTPSDFEAYRMSYDILGPCCLCPFQFRDIGNFKEAAVSMMSRGRYVGEYVATCADGRCHYIGRIKPVNGGHELMYFVQDFLERLHGCRGTRVGRYARRGK